MSDIGSAEREPSPGSCNDNNLGERKLHTRSQQHFPRKINCLFIGSANLQISPCKQGVMWLLILHVLSKFNIPKSSAD
jgi:hypothetical protein